MIPGMWSIILFLSAALVIGVIGPRLAALAETLAIRTGLGQAMSGAILLGAATSISGITTSVSAAIDGHAELSMANAIGGIAAQTVFLAIADITYTKANLEHAAASPTNILQGALLIGLVSFILLAMVGPDWTILWVHPATLLLFAGYVFGMRIAYRSHREPMWRPMRTRFTQREDAEEGADDDRRSTARLFVAFFICAGVLAVAGWLLARTGFNIAAMTGLGQTVVGGLFTALATSLPELVTTLAAVRRGAIALAVGDIIGGNAFDTLFAAVSDLFYLEGSIYHDVSTREMFLGGLAILLNAVLIMGLVRREKMGIAKIGFESFFILVMYAAGFLTVALTGAGR